MMNLRLNFGDALLGCAGIVMLVALVLEYAAMWLYITTFVALMIAFWGGMHANEPR